MFTHFKNRLLVTSLALAAAGILTCVACVIDVIFPRGSLLAFLGWMFAAVIAIVAIMISFAWSCERVDDRSRARELTAQHDGVDRPRADTSARDNRFGVLLDRSSRPAAPYVTPPLTYYPIMMRGATPPTGKCHPRMRHGL